MLTNQKYVHIYNFQQAEFYFSKGITPIKVGKGNKGDFYILFLKTNQLDSVFTEWCNRWKPIKINT